MLPFETFENVTTLNAIMILQFASLVTSSKKNLKILTNQILLEFFKVPVLGVNMLGKILSNHPIHL